MPRLNFSAEQKRAIETKGHVIVSAGAGSGKTAVMIERIVDKLLSGFKLDDMLIVTFTRAAAADMRVKLALRLNELKRGDAATAAIAAEALAALPVCNIGTLHSFCQRLIRAYFYAAEIDPAAVVMDESEAEKYKTACIAAAVKTARDAPSAEFIALSDALCTRRSDDGLIRAVRSCVEFALSLSDPYGYLSGTKADSEYFAALDGMLTEMRGELVEEAELLNADIKAAGFTKIQKAAEDLIPYIDGLTDEITPTRVTASGDATDLLNDRLKALKAECKEYRETAVVFERAKTIDSAPYSVVLCELAKVSLEKYGAVKATLSRIDYSDLEHGALKALNDEKCMKELAAWLKFVFIDEYQDVNPLQAEIAAKLKSGAGAEMFLVGDIKQSIYAFRRCDPKYFKDALRDPEYTKISLNDNYRSSRAVIDFINKVFVGVMSENFGGADYDKDRLIYGKNGSDDGYAEFVVVQGEENDKNAPKETRSPSVGDEYTLNGVPPTYSVAEAVKDGEAPPDSQVRFIVDSILDYVDGGADGKPHSFGSVAVLMRSARTAFCDELVAYMRKCGVPCRLGRNCLIGDRSETLMLLGILRYIDNRFDDIAMYTAMRSPMGGFSDAELLEIAENGEAEALRTGIKPEYGAKRKSYCFWQKADAYKGGLKQKLEEFKALRARFADLAADSDASDVMSAVTSGVDYFRYVFETGGNAAAIEAMIDDAAKRKVDLSSYIAAVNENTELAVNDGGDAVTVSTVHASKGLEYDYVIVADIGHGFQMKEATAPYIISGDGAAVKYPDAATRKLVASAPWLAASRAVPPRLREEELRLFYVALTRAKTRLTVCAGIGTKSRDPEKAACEYDYMKNVPPKIVSVGRRAETPAPEPLPVSPAVVEAVKEACEFKYPHSSRIVKTCVTALSEGGMEAAFAITDDDRRARYGSETETDAAMRMKNGSGESLGSSDDVRLRGTAYHRAMELVDIDDPDENYWRENCENFELVDFGKIVKAAAFVKKLASGGTILRERPFIVDLPLCDGQSGIAGDKENVLLQGVIDLLIIKDGGEAVIVDYKTSSPKTLLCDAYKTQLELYARAVEKATEKSARPLRAVKKYLYSFVEDRAIEV